MFLIDSILEIKKQHVSCFGLSLAILGFHIRSYVARVLYNYCKRALVLSTHHLRVWSGFRYSISVKSWYCPDAVYLHWRWRW